MPKGPIKSNLENTLLFIDTNIYLDFYRLRDSKVEKKWLSNLQKYSDSLIMTEQGYMEILKNRQKVILESFKQIKKVTEQEKKLNIPAFISDKQSAKGFKDSLDKCGRYLKKIEKEYIDILKNTSKDSVYCTISQIIENIKPLYYLSRSMGGDENIRFDIREMAKKRFYMGYPPRKSNDTSYVDGINWEWIIYCAKKYKKHVVIVSRDTDYGCLNKGEKDTILNDWLKKEFQKRVSTRKKILIFDRLSSAFKHFGLKISKAEISNENEIVSKNLD